MSELHRRGDRGAYLSYLDQMDASMRQKIALTAAHLLCEGRVADMGMGSGTGSHALAALYPTLEVVGVDLDPTMVELARARYVLPNLRFMTGDIASRVFEERSLDAIFDSSVLHHVTTFNGYDHDAARRALSAQVEALAEDGILIVRDFVDPGEGTVVLDLPDDDGGGTAVETASSATLFERFAREFRSLSSDPGFAFERLPPARPGWRRFRTSLKHAAEFALRKDYRESWEAEVKEEYTYFTQERFEQVFAELGLRVLASIPIRNPWIVRNRFAGRLALSDLAGGPLEFPATNYLIVGQRVADGDGVVLVERERAAPIGFLALEHYRDRETGLVRRPHRTVDVVPYFESDGDVLVLVRMGYPRPIVLAGTPPLDRARPPSYATEPLVVIETDKPLGRTVEDALERRAGVAPDSIRSLREASTYYPSPGGLLEEVRSVFVEIEPLFHRERAAHESGFHSSGRVAAVDAQQLLRAAQVGSLGDGRIELNVYDLLLSSGREVGPWIGDAIALEIGEPAAESSLASLLARPRARRFSAVAERAGFLDLRAGRFAEKNRASEIVAERVLEYVVPARHGTATIAVAPLRRDSRGIRFGVDLDHLPAAQAFGGNSEILVAPAWRIPTSIASMTPAIDFVRERLEREHGLELGECWELGGRYFPSAGATPEVVYAIAIEVKRESEPARALHWVELGELVRGRHRIRDGHIRIASIRAAHATGLLSAERGAVASRSRPVEQF